MNGIWPCAVGQRLTRGYRGTAGMYNFVCYVSGFVSRTQHCVQYIMILWNVACIPATVLWRWLLKRRACIALQFFNMISVVFPNPSSRVRFPAERLFFLIAVPRAAHRTEVSRTGDLAPWICTPRWAHENRRTEWGAVGGCMKTVWMKKTALCTPSTEEVENCRLYC